MEHPYRPLYGIGVAVLITGLIVGVAFTGVSGDTVLLSTIALAGAMWVLLLLSRRDNSHDPDGHSRHDRTGR